jgi:hypothetical protein
MQHSKILKEIFARTNVEAERIVKMGGYGVSLGSEVSLAPERTSYKQR